MNTLCLTAVGKQMCSDVKNGKIQCELSYLTNAINIVWYSIAL
jgi:hypothetical protein